MHPISTLCLFVPYKKEFPLTLNTFRLVFKDYLNSYLKIDEFC